MIRNQVVIAIFVSISLALSALAQPGETADAEPVGTRVQKGTGIDLFKHWPEATQPKKSDLTIECWIKPDAETIALKRALVFMLSNRGGADIASVGIALHQGVPHATVFGAYFKSTAKLPADRWAHVAITLNSKTINKIAQFWVNGKMVAEELVLGPWPKSFEIASMLSDPWNLNRVFTGMLGDVRISQEIQYAKDFKPAARLKRDTATVLLLAGGKIPSK